MQSVHSRDTNPMVTEKTTKKQYEMNISHEIQARFPDNYQHRKI